jgi:hypothetical protein
MAVRIDQALTDRLRVVAQVDVALNRQVAGAHAGDDRHAGETVATVEDAR